MTPAEAETYFEGSWTGEGEIVGRGLLRWLMSREPFRLDVTPVVTDSAPPTSRLMGKGPVHDLSISDRSALRRPPAQVNGAHVTPRPAGLAA